MNLSGNSDKNVVSTRYFSRFTYLLATEDASFNYLIVTVDISEGQKPLILTATDGEVGFATGEFKRSRPPGYYRFSTSC